MTLGMMPHGTMSWCHMAPWRITTRVVWENPPKGHKHVTLITCMYDHHCDKCHKLRYLERNILGGKPTIRWGAKKIIIIKGRKGGKRMEEESRERSSTFSLNFPAIGTVVPDEARRKVLPRRKGFK